MIRYRLKCKKGHEFEAWFASSDAFDKQEKRDLRHQQGLESPDGAAHLQAQGTGGREGSG